MEHLLFEAVGRGLVGNARIRVIKHALLARAGGTDVAAGVAADAAGKLPAPEGKAFFGA